MGEAPRLIGYTLILSCPGREREGLMTWKSVNETAVLNGRISKVLNEFPINHHAVCLDKKVRIRPYHATDRPAIRALCCDTGFLGRPVDTLFRDRELFADLFTNAYLDHEPEWAFVAEVDGRVIGYLLGAISPRFDLALIRSGFRTTVKMLLRLAAGRYDGHPRSRRFIRWLLTHGFSEQPKHPAHAAHLHLDLDKGFRGRGICARMWEMYERRLQRVGVRQCYGAFFSYARRRPESVYARYGFQVFDRKPTTIFYPEIPDPVEVVCVAKTL
jgi:ribosomal protein S18 acetylase RimI-like enzyme